MIKNTENTIYVQNQKPYDLKGWFEDVDDIINPGNEKYSKFFYYYAGMLAHDMSTGDIYIWRERQNGEVTQGLLNTDFHYQYERIDFNYNYTDTYFNFFPYIPSGALLLSNIHSDESPTFNTSTNTLAPLANLGGLSPAVIHVKVYLNGLRQKEGIDYTLNGDTGVITFLIGLVSTDIIIIDYISNN